MNEYQKLLGSMGIDSSNITTRVSSEDYNKIAGGKGANVLTDSFQGAYKQYKTQEAATSGLGHNRNDSNGKKSSLWQRVLDRLTVKDSNNRSYLNKGLLEDGVDEDDIWKTILATMEDVRENAWTGAFGLVEGIADAVAPLLLGEEGGSFAAGDLYDEKAEVKKALAKAKGIQELYAQGEQRGYTGPVDIERAKEITKEIIEANPNPWDRLTGKVDYSSIAGLQNLEGNIGPLDIDKAKAIIDKDYAYRTTRLERESIAGEKIDSAAQSMGQMFAQKFLTLPLESAAPGISEFIQKGTQFLSAYGDQYEAARRDGASHTEAMASAAISGAAEVIWEMMSGAVKFGGSTWDEATMKTLSRSVRNQFARTGAKFLLDMGGEGTEEFLTEATSKFGEWLTYKKNRGENLKDILLSESSRDELIESFFTGALMGGAFDVAGAVGAKASGRDFASGLTANEEQVVNKIYKDRVAEAEKDGKVTQKQKNQIYDEVVESMDKGEISTDKIEEILGGNSYKSYKDAADNYATLKKELDELRQMKKGDMNDIQLDRLAELKGMNLDDTSDRDSLKAMLGSEVSELVKGDRLAESYNQKAQRGKGFSVDLNKVDEKQRHIYQKAMDSQVVNNSTRAHEFVGLVARIAADKGIDFDFTNNQKLKDSGLAIGNAHISGYVNEDGVTINMQSPNALNAVVGHEVAHVLEGTELYGEMQNMLFEYAKPKGKYLPRYKAIKERYEEVYKNLSPEELETKIDQEVTADLVGELLFTDKDFINNLYAGNRTVFDKIYDEIKYLCKVVTARSKEARQLEKVKKMFADAYRAESKISDEVRYSITYTEDNKPVAVIDEDVFDGKFSEMSESERIKVVKKAIKSFRPGIPISGRLIKVTGKTAEHFANSDYTDKLRNHDSAVYEDKLNISNNIDDVIYASTDYINEDLKHPRKDNIVEFARGKVLLDIGGHKYEAKVLVGYTTMQEMVLYDVQDFTSSDFTVKEKKAQPTLAGNESDTRKTVVPSNNILPQEGAMSSGTEVQGLSGDNIGPVRNTDIGPVREIKPALSGDIAPVRKSGNYNIMSEDVYFDPTKKDIAPVRADIGPVNKVTQNAPQNRVIAPVPIKNKKQGIISKVVNRTVDKGMVFENLSLKSGNMELQSKWDYALPSKAEARAQWFMRNGRNGSVSLDSVRKKVEAAGKTEAFQDYMQHWRNVDSMTLRERFGVNNKPVFDTSVSADISRKKIAQYEKENPEFKGYADELYAYFAEERKMMVESGLITEEQAKHMEEMYPHYIPLHREADELLGPVQTNNLGVNTPIKSATGGSRPLQPMFDTIAQHTLQTFKAVARNDFGVELKNTIQTTARADATDADEIFDSIENQNRLLGEGSDGSGYTFSVYENGQKVTFDITEAMYDALKPTDGLLGERIKPLTKLNDIRRNLITSWNPVFALYRNPVKDIQDVMINSQHPLKTYMNVPKAAWELFELRALGKAKGKWANEYLENGGEQNTYYDNRKGAFAREDPMWRKIIGFPARGLETLGEFIERVPRLAEYIASRESGRSVQRSMLDAARVTTNFAAGGDFTKFLNSHGFTFLNAGVQGFSQNVRNFREAKMNGFKGYVQLAAKFTVAGLSAGILNGLFWDEEDDEDYEELSDYVKQNYYVVAKTSDGKFVRIPKGRMAAVIQDGMEQMEHLVTGDDEADFESFFKLVMDNLAPGNPLDNNILAPIAQVLEDKTWYGEDLVPSRLADLPAAEQFDESTDSLSKWLGEKMDISPYKINYLIDQYSGGLGDVFLPMMTPEAESGDNSFFGNLKAPWKKEWTTDSVLNNKHPSEFFELSDELEVISNGKNATDEDKVRNLYMSSVGWEMSDLYAEKREIQNSDLPDDQKYEAVREVQKEINALAEKALQNYQNVKVDGLYATAGDKRFDYSEYNGKWYEIEGEYLEKEQDAVRRYGITPSEYWNDTDLYYHADWYFDNQYADPHLEEVAKLVFGGKKFAPYAAELSQIKADKDQNGNSISGSKKAKVFDYINSLNISDIEKKVMRKMNYPSEDKYNWEIFAYVDGRDDFSYDEKKQILEALGAKVDDRGRVKW